jgi:uncharacterized membrane protein HdeD (DUF308 family)
VLEDWLALRWTTLLLRGAVGVGFGVLAMAWPDETVVVLVVLWGFWAMLDGVLTIGSAGGLRGSRAMAPVLVVGLLSLVAAFFALVRPGLAATTLTWFIGIWLVVRGVSEIAGAFAVKGSGGRAVLVLSGVVDGVLGVLFLANPGQAVLSLAFVLGVFAFVWGLIIVFAALAVRRHARAVPATAGSMAS